MVQIKKFMYGIDFDSSSKLLKYGLMTMVSCLILPIVQIIIRNYLGTHLSWQEAGYWQGMMRISDAYLAVITATLSVYYLPTLSALQTKEEIKKEVILSYKTIFPAIIILSVDRFYEQKRNN